MSKDDTTPVAIVTGASKGIGKSIAIEMARSGYYTIVNYHSDRDGAAEALSQIESAGGAGEIMQFDVADNKAVQACVKDILGRFDRVEVLVNNAGVTADGLMMMMSEANWDRVVNVTLKGFYNMTKPLLKKMVRKKKGAIVSISSAAGLMGNKGQANYSAAKAGLIGASRSLAAEVARTGVRVNVVAPGLIETEMIEGAPVEDLRAQIPMDRAGQPEEVAKVVRFLCSEDASYITRQVISVNGGMV